MRRAATALGASKMPERGIQRLEPSVPREAHDDRHVGQRCFVPAVADDIDVHPKPREIGNRPDNLRAHAREKAPMR